MSHFRDVMRRNWETLDLDKIQDDWYDRVNPGLYISTYNITPIGAVGTSLGCSANVGRSFSKTFVAAHRKSSTLRGWVTIPPPLPPSYPSVFRCPNCMTRSNTALCTIARSSSPSSTRTAVKREIEGSMSCTPVRRHSLISSPLRNTVSSPTKSILPAVGPFTVFS